MTLVEHAVPRLPLVPGDVVEAMRDPEMEGYFLDAYLHGTPPPISLSLDIHQPEAMRAWCRFWWSTFHGGLVEHPLKELLRVGIARAADCGY